MVGGGSTGAITLEVSIRGGMVDLQAETWVFREEWLVRFVIIYENIATSLCLWRMPVFKSNCTLILSRLRFGDVPMDPSRTPKH